MPQLDTPAIVLSALRYSETSKIVRLATRDHGVQSAIAKGALRPRSRFGAALQFLSEGQARLLAKEHRELHTLAGFDLLRLHVGLAAGLDRYATASALAEVMLRFAPADPHPESYDVLRDSLDRLEEAPADQLEALGFRALWRLVSVWASRRRWTPACSTGRRCRARAACRSAPAKAARCVPPARRATAPPSSRPRPARICRR